MRQTQAEHAALVRMYDTAPLVGIEAEHLHVMSLAPLELA